MREDGEVDGGPARGADEGRGADGACGAEPAGAGQVGQGVPGRAYEPAPGAGRLLLFVGVFLFFALVVIGGGVYLTAG